MKIRLYTLVLAALLASACSTTRILEKDQYRLARNRLTIKEKSELTPGSLSPYIRQEANGSGIFGWPWDSPGKNTGVGCHFLLQGIFLTQGSNPGLLHCRQTSSLSEPPGKQ